MSILISGASGFIGRNLCASLFENNIDFITLNLRSEEYRKESGSSIHLSISSSYDEILRTLSKCAPEKFLHLASVWRQSEISGPNGDIFDLNIRFAHNLAKVCAVLQIPFINFGTYWQLNQVRLPTNTNLYTLSKKFFDEIIDYYIANFSLQASTLYLYDNFGEGDNRGKVISRMIESGFSNNRIQLHSAANEINLLHVDDVVSGILAFLRNNRNPRFVEISNSVNFTFGAIVRTLNTLLENDLDVSWNLDLPSKIDSHSHVPIYPRPLHWSPVIEVDKGLMRVIDFEKKKRL